MKTRYILFVLLFYFATSNMAFSQHNHIECGTATPSVEEVELTQKFIINYQSNPKNLRPSADPIYIPIKVHMVLNDAGVLPDLLFFNPKSFNESLAATNAIFKSVNIQFYFTGTINYIKSTKLLNFTRRSSTNFVVDGFTHNADEDELCKAHEIPNAVNLFLTRTIKLDNGVNGIILPAGYANIPTSMSISKYNTNRVFMDTQHFGGTSNQTDNTLTHELGHFFGLYHTFDSIGGKELVTRGTGANCSTAGDLVCDTPADPYSSLPAGSADFQTCGAFLSTIKDANGETYTTDKSNIMSYYANTCQKGFTQGQFDRINASLALRKTNSTYGKFDAPDSQVEPVSFSGSVAYNGGNVWLSIKDNANNETGYILERATSATGEFTVIKGYAENAFSMSDELFDIDTKNIPKLFYRVKASNSKNAYSNVSEVAVKPKKYCIPGMNTKCNDNPSYPTFSAIKSSGTNLDETFNLCLNPSNYTYLTKTIAMQTNTSYPIDILMRYSINLPHDIYAYIDVNKNGTFDNNERIYFTNTKGATPTTKNFSFNLNTNNLSGEYGVRIKAGYTLDVNADACAAMFWGETIDFSVNVLGPLVVKAGDIASPSVCPNANIIVPFSYEGSPPTVNTKYTIQLSDNQGLNYKELSTTIEGTNLKAAIPANTKAGAGYRIKVVSTSPSSESISPTSLTIKANATATFETKDLAIDQYKSADIKLALTGDVPIKLKLSDGQNLDFNELNPTIKLAPNTTTEYKISSVSNTCGDGVASAVALKITVNVINANEPTFEAIQVFPNPSAEKITVKFDKQINANQKLQLIDNKGVMFFQKTIESNEESISLKEIPIGIYHVRIMDGKQVLSKKMIKIE
jgi:hypothetical protein